MLEASTLIVSVLLGPLIGRWWSIILAVPAGLVAAATFSFEGFSDAEVGILFGIAIAIGLVVRTALRNGVRMLSEKRPAA